jgi:phospholipid-translocating ATPase
MLVTETESDVLFFTCTGQETKAMLNNGGPRHKRTGLEKMMNLEVMWCVVLLAVMCIVGATGSSLWFTSYTNPAVPFAIHADDADYNPVYEAFLSFWTFIIILQVSEMR